MTTAAVLAGDARWSVDAADCLAWLPALPDDSVDLLLCSPPYEAARTYGIGFKLRGQDWVDWMASVVRAAAPKVTGLIAVVCEGQTRGYRYSCAPVLLMADLHRAGFHLRKPVAFQRVGIPGSGGPDWLRNDYEFVVCVARPGRLPWSDNTACGHPPKWAPGGEFAHRLSDGTRVNQWGEPTGSEYAQRKQGGERQKAERPSHVVTTRKQRGEIRRAAVEAGAGTTHKAVDSSSYGDSETEREWNYVPPVLANPGNVVRCNVGGNQMGHPLAHENEAPFPLDLAEFFVRSFCPPGGVVCDVFAGSGTTAQAALEHGRRFVGCDVRASQVELIRRRMATVTPGLF